jgi:hypothetical protein
MYTLLNKGYTAVKRAKLVNECCDFFNDFPSQRFQFVKAMILDCIDDVGDVKSVIKEMNGSLYYFFREDIALHLKKKH